MTSIVDILRDTGDAFDPGTQSTVAVLATGLGKTQIFSAIAKHWPGRVLVLAHRSELIEQARARLEEMTGELVAVEQAGFRAGAERLVVATVQTLYRESRLARFKRNHFSLVIIDECHHGVARTYRAITEYFGAAKILGVTATPDRADEKALGKVFESVAFRMDINEGIDAGYLVPLRGVEVAIQELDLSHIKSSKGDLAEGELDDEMMKHATSVTHKVVELVPGKSCVVFTPGVKSAHLFAECFNALVPGSAAAIDGGTPKDERKHVIREFRAGRIRYLCNCMVATEGFDAPNTEVVVMARPTKSRSLYAQCVGRGTRVLPGTVEHIEGEENAEARRAAIAASKKPSAVILDVTGNAGKHTLVCPVDLLGGDYSDEEKKVAKKKMQESPGGDVREQLAQARKELVDKERVRAAKVKAQVREFDPFTNAGILRLDMERLNVPHNNTPPSQAQLDALKRAGMTDQELRELTNRSAKAALKALGERRAKGLATLKQLHHLRKFGVTDPNIMFGRASEVLDYCFEQKRLRRPIDPKAVDHIVMKGR